MSYSVGEMAKLAGTSVRTLHHYDEVGLLVPSERSRVGYRRYSEADRERLGRILTYRALGFDLARIMRILDDPAVDVDEQLRQQRSQLGEQVGQLHLTLRRLEEMMAPDHAETSETRGPVGLLGICRRLIDDNRRLLLGVGGLAMGWVTGILEQFVRDETLVDAPSFLILITATIGLATFHRKRGHSKSFFGDMAWCWIGYGLGWTIIDAGLTELVVGLVGFGLPVAFVCWAILRSSSASKQSGVTPAG